MKLLDRLSIVKVIIFSVLLFSISLMALSVLTIKQAWTHWQDEKSSIRLIRLMQIIDETAHEHAIERGMTAGYLQNPSAERAQRLQQQRLQADRTFAKLLAQLNQQWPEDLQVVKELIWLPKHRQTIAQVRQQVDDGSAPQAFKYFSVLNALALDMSQLLQTSVNDNHLQKIVNSALSLARFKERAGQLRDKIYAALVAGKVAPEDLTLVRLYVEELEVIKQYLPTLLQGELASRANRILTSSGSQQIHAVYQTVLNEENPSATQSLLSADEWFELASQQISEVNGLMQQQWQAAQSKAVKEVNGAKTSLVTQLTILSVIIGFLSWLNYKLIKSMRNKLKELSIHLDKVAKDGDLTIDLHFDGNNELSEISRSVQHMIEAFRDLVAGLSRSVTASTTLNASLNEISEKVLGDAEMTQKMATNITAAVEEMSATSDDIAKSASSTLEASDQLYSETGRSIQFNEDNSQAMQQLADAMTGVEQRALKMEDQVVAISSILDTINQLADQTNLLALNAAIEAARAGDAGRGFAVVADEVRTLAKGSKDSSGRIAKLLSELQSASNRVVDGVKENVVTAKQTLEKSENARRISVELQKQAKTVEEMSMQVATAAEQQSVTARHIAGDTNKVLEAADDELEATQEMKKVFDDMTLNSQTLQRTMKHFKIE